MTGTKTSRNSPGCAGMMLAASLTVDSKERMKGTLPVEKGFSLDRLHLLFSTHSDSVQNNSLTGWPQETSLFPRTIAHKIGFQSLCFPNTRCPCTTKAPRPQLEKLRNLEPLSVITWIFMVRPCRKPGSAASGAAHTPRSPRRCGAPRPGSGLEPKMHRPKFEAPNQSWNICTSRFNLQCICKWKHVYVVFYFQILGRTGRGQKELPVHNVMAAG